ncbi:MAG TPA: hypothetical protein VFR84_16710 [Candidatus Angelobacter sp.]|nr:hypothetical protein [Candidatus Angelobacter sp.]
MNGNGYDQGPIETREIKPRDPSDPLATKVYKGQFYSQEEVYELMHRESAVQTAKEDREKWEESEAGQLCIAFYEAFRAYEKYLQEHPSALRKYYSGKRVDYEEQKAFEQALKFMEDDRRERAEKDRKNLEKAQRAARCRHVHANGEQCGAPRVRGKKLCHMHERMQEMKPEKPGLDLGPMEDPDSIQMGIKKLQAAIIDGKLEGKLVGQLAYTIQLAAWNVMRTSLVKESP